MPAHAQAQDMLTPESYTEHITLQPVVTKVVKEEDLKTALRDLNILHGKMAEEGWEIFQILEYTDGGNFEGFFATYKRMSNF